MNRGMYELQRMGVGLLLKDSDKTIYSDITDKLRERWQRSVVITNDPRMIKALELCGYEVMDRSTVTGIEVFQKCF
jgi:hypothetical protein